MKGYNSKNGIFIYLLLFIFSGVIFLSSCKDDIAEFHEPEWLGESIYKMLQNGYTDDDGKLHTFKTYVKLIDTIGYDEVLKRTGSKTLFVADDESFDRFYTSNSWGVTRYGDFSLSQMKLILNSSMINNAMLIENLSTIEGPLDGQVMRRSTALSVSDTIPFIEGGILPENSYWNRFRSKGIRMVKDNTPIPMLLFLESQMSAKHITDDDFLVLFNGKTRETDDAYIYNIKVKKRDIVCQNGYVHVLEDVLIPPSNMADVINDAPETQTFSSFLDRYTAPYYDENLTNQFSLLGGIDSVFIKRYFSERSSASGLYQSGTVIDPNGDNVSYYLKFDPGWNMYTASDNSSFQTDMGAIFAPTDDAFDQYFNDGAGKVLIDRYGSVEDIPNDVLNILMNNHMETSFLAAIPSLFTTLVDDAQEDKGVKESDVEKVYLASNGVVYVTNTVYAPALYTSVMFPAVINENMKVFRWAIDNLEYRPYLLSMVNYYSFLLPTDNFTYVVPTSLKHNQPEAWKFHYDNVHNTVYASVHPYDITTHAIGDSIRSVSIPATLKNHLQDMLDYHIIVGNIEDGKDYYRTKGGGTIRISHEGNTIQLAGGGDIERDDVVPVEEIYDQTAETNGKGNGKTYIINEPVQTPTKSVYSILSDKSEFSEFFKLLQGYDDLWVGDDERATRFSIFYTDKSQAGLDYNVRFLNTFHYTLYVPANDAVLEAIHAGLPTWDDVEAATDQEVRDALAEKIIRFLRYHFQDNAVYLDNPSVSASYETATLDTSTDTFYKLKLEGGNYAMNITTASGEVAHVITDGGLYNIMARDFKFNTADPVTATTIATSSYIVIHQIDKCLYFSQDELK